MSQSNVRQTVFENVEVGRDFTFEGDINQTVVQQRPDFFEPSLERYKSPLFKSPKITSQLLARLKHLRFLVLAGSSDVDKDSLTRHTASCLIEELAAGGEQIMVQEWYRRSDSQSVEIELQKTEKPTVFILTQVTPQNIGYDLNTIIRMAKSCQHYVIVSTGTTFTAWRQPSTNQKYWYEVSPDKVADCQKLINQNSEEDSLSKWYLGLEPRERLLALGLSFFDGLFDDQFFAALEEIVETVWQKRDSSLRALDYCDFEKLEESFFNFTETKNQGTKINIRFPKQRRILFKVAWNRDRRQILAALPVMVDIVNQSVSRSFINPELYGTNTKCNEVRKAIAETISDIGSISVTSVQTTLLQLAANNDTRVQSTAAYAMAQWRDPDYKLDQQLFDTLHSWLDLLQAKRIIEEVEAILQKRNLKNDENLKAENYIKMTVALTVGYASLYDPPREMLDSDGLSEELCDLLKKLAIDASRNVRNTFLFVTLPQVLQLHLNQLSDWLYDLTKKQANSNSKKSIIQVNQAVGESLALAYQNYPKDTLKLLNKWTEEAQRNFSKSIDKNKITSRESLLATVARTYGEIDYIQGDNQLTPSDVFIRLHAIIEKEKHPFVREAVLFAIGRQARRDFEAIESELQALVGEVKEKERQNIVDILSDIYFEQRINLSGGDYWVTQKIPDSDYSYRYQIWIDEDRPQTFIEKAMKDWFKNANNVDAQAIALRSLNSFAKHLDKYEEKEKERIIRNLDAEPKSQEFAYIDEEFKSSPNLYVRFIVPWLTICLKWAQYIVFNKSYYKSFASQGSCYKQIVSGVLPEALKQDLDDQDTMKFVLKRLTTRSDSDKELSIIVDILKLAIFIAKRPLVIVVTGIVGIVIIIITF